MTTYNKKRKKIFKQTRFSHQNRATFLDYKYTKMDEIDSNYQANTYAGMVGKSQLMRERVFALIDKAARADITVLLLGETGTGKELASQAIHKNSKRSKGPYVPFNCADIPENALEDELYGHVKGAFAGAGEDRTGRFTEASGGTLFLDEIGCMGMRQQSRLLRVLEDRLVTPIGSKNGSVVDTRILAATNQDLYTAVPEGAFRKDLYYRLSALKIQIPPLRERMSEC